MVVRGLGHFLENIAKPFRKMEGDRGGSGKYKYVKDLKYMVLREVERDLSSTKDLTTIG